MGNITIRIVCKAHSFAIALSRLIKVHHPENDQQLMKCEFHGTAILDYFRRKKKKKTKRRHDVVMQNVTAKMILNYFPCLKIGRKINNKVNLQ